MKILGYPALPAYIVAGVLVSPFIAVQDLLTLGEVGVMFLLYVFGVKFTPSQVSSVGWPAFTVSFLQIVIIGSIGVGTGYALGLTLFDSVLLGFVAAFSSTLIGLELSEEERHNKLLHGRLSESIHLIQDITGLLLLGIVFGYSSNGALLTMAYMVLLILVTTILRRTVFPFVANSVKFNQEIVMLLGLSTLIGFVYGAMMMGLPFFVGAFFAGLASAQFPYNLELLDTFGPIKDFFTAVFFVVLGALISVPSLSVLFVVFGLVFLVVVLKPVVTSILLRLHGYTDRVSILTSLATNHVSELSFILVIHGLILGVVSDMFFTIVVLTGVLSMIIASLLKKHQEEIYSLFNDDFDTGSIDKTGHVLVIGAIPGTVEAAKYLSSEGEDVVVVDTDSERLKEVPHGIQVYNGDIMNHDVLRHLCVSDASIVLSGAKSHAVSQKLLRVDGPEVIVHAENAVKAKQYYEEGASYVLLKDIAIIDLLKEYVVNMSEKERLTLKERGLNQLRRYEYR